VDNKAAARNNLAAIDDAISKLGLHRSHLSAFQASLAANVQVVGHARENLSAGNSRMRDTDMAEWTAKSVQQDILAQSGGAMIAQANNLGRGALKLLGAE
jgi:flagellin